MKKRLFFLFLIMISCSVTWAAPVYETMWSGILNRRVSTGNRQGIDTTLFKYASLKEDSSFKLVLQEIEAIDLSQFKKPEEAKAFWINVYNIAAIKMVSDAYPIRQLVDRGSFFQSVFDMPAIVVAHKTYTLRQLSTLLLDYKDTRVPFALCTTALSSPDLGLEPYRFVKLDRQLDAAVKQFRANPTKHLLLEEPGSRTVPFNWRLNDGAL